MENNGFICIWDFDTLTVKSTASNIELKHAVYNYMTEDYNDAAISYEYYVEVTGINNRIIDDKFAKKLQNLLT